MSRASPAALPQQAAAEQHGIDRPEWRGADRGDALSRAGGPGRPVRNVPEQQADRQNPYRQANRKKPGDLHRPFLREDHRS
jgi:hypothetical protein